MDLSIKLYVLNTIMIISVFNIECGDIIKIFMIEKTIMHLSIKMLLYFNQIVTFSRNFIPW